MKRAQVLIAALFAAGVASVLSTESAGSHVVHLDSNNYDDAVSDGKVYLIKYFAPWCGHCKRLAPTWAELADELKDEQNIVIAHVDCTTDRDVKGYPTLKVIHNGEEAKAYRGSRDLQALKKFAIDTANDLLTETKA